METLIKLPDSAAPSTVADILASLRKEHFEPRHEAKAWGDWIYLNSYTTVISIECNHGLSSTATIEHGEGEEEGEPVTSLYRAFGRLGWLGMDSDGEFPLESSRTPPASASHLKRPVDHLNSINRFDSNGGLRGKDEFHHSVLTSE